MQQIVITKKNGVTLSTSMTVAIDPEKIVRTRADGSACEFIYAESDSRRIPAVKYTAGNTKAQVDAFIAGGVVALTVYANIIGGQAVNNTTEAWTVQKKYIEDIVEGYVEVAGTATSCRVVRINYGAFKIVTIYVTNSLASITDALVTTTTTTTTTAAPTTTTTTAAATTTTTAAATTTTTAAATTTTTAAATTTTTAAATTTTTAAATTTTTAAATTTTTAAATTTTTSTP